MTEGESNIAVVAERMKALAADMQEVKIGMGRLTDAVTKLAVIEVRQSEASKASDRAFMDIDKLDVRIIALGGRVSAIEQGQPMQKQTSDWITKVGALIAAAVITAIVSTVVFKPDLVRLPTRPAASSQ